MLRSSAWRVLGPTLCDRAQSLARATLRQERHEARESSLRRELFKRFAPALFDDGGSEHAGVFVAKLLEPALRALAHRHAGLAQ